MLGRTLAGLPAELRSALAGDPHWTSAPLSDLLGALPEQLDRLAEGYCCADRRVLATLWWYVAADAVCAPALASLLITGLPLSVDPLRVRLHTGPDGRAMWSSTDALVGGAESSTDPAAVLRALAGELAICIRAVVRAATAAGGHERALWAIASDAIANRALWAGRVVGDVERGTGVVLALAAEIGPELPRPRFVDVGPRSARFLQRASCCLIYAAPGESMCTSCPRRPPEERHELLRAAARYR